MSSGNPEEEKDEYDQARKAASAAEGAAFLADLEARYHQVVEDRNRLKTQLEQEQARIVTMERNLATQQGAAHDQAELQHRLTLAHEDVQAITAEKAMVEDRVTRFEAELDTLRDEIRRLQTTNDKLSKSAADHEMQSTVKDSEVIPLFREKQRLQAELDSLQSHATWLETELHAKSQDYQRLQQDSRDRSIQLQLQLDHTQGEKEGAEVQLEELRKMERRLQQQVEVLSNDLFTAKQELANSREQLQLEVQEEHRIVDLQREHIVRWEHRYNDLVRENEGLHQSAHTAMQASQNDVQQVTRELEQKYERLLEEQAREYEQKLRDSAGPGSAVPRIAAAALPAAIAAQDDGPISLTDLYTQLSQTKVAVEQERLRAERAEHLNERIMSDLTEKAPQLIRQREEFEHAMDQLEEYQRRLDNALGEYEDARADLTEARREISRLRKVASDRQVESQTLAQQVQALLVSRAGGTTDVDVPTNVAEVQSQNQRLLVERRQLTDQVAELQRRIVNDDSKSKLEAAEEELLSLRDEQKKQHQMVHRIVQQRDLYRAILHKHDTDVLSGEAEEESAIEMARHQTSRADKLNAKLKELETELTTAQGAVSRLEREKESMMERVTRHETLASELRKAVDQSDRERIALRGENARLLSEASFHKNKCEQLEETVRRTQGRADMENRSKHELERINADLQQSLSSLEGEASRARSDLRQTESKARSVEARYDAAKASEQRLLQESNQLRKEVTQHGTVLETIRRIESSLSAKAKGEIEELKNEKIRLETLVKELQTQKTTQIDDLQTRIDELERTSREAAGANEAAKSRIVSLKGELVELTSAKDALSSKYDNLQAELSTAKSRGGCEEDDEESALQTRIVELTSQLDAATREKLLLEERAATYERMAKDAEEALNENQKATAVFNYDYENETTSLKKQIESMKADAVSTQEIVVDLTRDLAGQRDEREKREAELRDEIGRLQAELRSHDKDGESSEAAIGALKLDLDNYKQEASKAQETYERELELHSQARTALRIAREQAQEEVRKRVTLEEQIAALTREEQEKRVFLEEDKAGLDEIADSLRKSLDEARKQNEALHAQLDALAQVVEESRDTAATSVPESEATGTDDAGVTPIQKALTEQREIIKFLRSENDLLKTQLETVQRKLDRERASSQSSKRSLDEARSELKRFQEGQDSMVDSTNADADQNKIISMEEQIGLLRDSNKFLRDESSSLRESLDKAVADLALAKEEAQPVLTKQRVQESKIASLEAEKASLLRDLGSWKGRVESLVSKFNQVDPEEHKRALKQVEDLKKEKESMTAWKTNMDAENTRLRDIARNINQRAKEQKTTIDGQKAEIEKLSLELETLASQSSATPHLAEEQERLKSQVTKLDGELSSTRTELEGANSRNDKLRDRLRQFQTAIKDLRDTEKDLREKMAEFEKPRKEIVIEGQAAAPAPSPEARLQRDAPGAIDSHLPVVDDVPKLPEGGFKFGPTTASTGLSDANTGNKSTSGSEVKPILHSGGSNAFPLLRADAPSFMPSQTSNAPVPFSAPGALPESIIHPPDVAEGAKAGGAAQELSFKEKLLEKKRKLAMAMEKKRKLEADAIPTAQGTDELPDPNAKKQKDDPEHNASAWLKSYAGEKLIPLRTATDTQEKGEGLRSSPSTEETNDNTTNKDGTASTLFGGTATNPFGEAVFGSSSNNAPMSFGHSASFGQTGAGFFGQSSGVAFGTTQSTSKGSEAAPNFQFGTSSSIKLPVPSQATATTASPFGAFGGGGGAFGASAGFGSFRSVSGGANQGFGARPLFGSQDSTSQDQAGDNVDPEANNPDPKDKEPEQADD